MFGEALLESAPTLRRRNHWPMAAAFAVELIVASVLVLLPLISTGILPLRATVIVPTPPKYTRVETQEPIQHSGNRRGVSASVARVVPVSTIGVTFIDPTTEFTRDSPGPPPLNPGGNGNPTGPDLNLKGPTIVPPPPRPPVVISHTTEAMLLNKVVPEYPLIAKISGIQGDVKLHAFVAKDGTIQSLTVLGNPPPVLTQAALDAVRKWKYRPYTLNGEPVEIETFITVTFKKSN
ncbi:MAG TPA: energy transducer TonB [Candidatus Angelobacter sp.]